MFIAPACSSVIEAVDDMVILPAPTAIACLASSVTVIPYTPAV